MAVPARLAERFGRSPLAVVTAPAGFGKTTLLQSWWDRAGDTPKTLVSFDTFRQPNALDAAHAHVRGLTAIGLSPAVADELVALVPPDAKSFGDAFVDAVVNELRAVPNDFVLFFDDAQGLVPEAARDLGRIVAMVATDDHRVVVAARGEPPWPIHRWRMSGLADVVGADDLRLTADEVAEMLGPEMAAFAARVATATGGWAAAVEAVRWRLRVDPSVEVEHAVLDLVDYVCAEVLPALDPSDVQVLARTAILEPFPATVAVAVTADDRAPRVLEQTALRTSLVTRFDDGRFAYHRVLREALRRQLIQLEPEIERELHVRAANLMRMCDLVGAMCGAQPSYLADVEPALAPAALPLVDQFVVAASARRRARLGDVAGAVAELRTTTPHELTLSAWVEVLLANHDRRFVSRWIRSLPAPTSLHGEIIRHLAAALTAERADEVATSAADAAAAAAADRLIGVLVDAPTPLWSRPHVTHSGHPLLLESDATSRHRSRRRGTPGVDRPRDRPLAPSPALARRQPAR